MYYFIINVFFSYPRSINPGRGRSFWFLYMAISPTIIIYFFGLPQEIYITYILRNIFDIMN